MKTLLFSNINGNVLSHNSINKCNFTKSQTKILKQNIVNDKSNLIFINAEGLENDENYFATIINCFKNIGIKFNNYIELSVKSSCNSLDMFPHNNRVYFLMGGNPFNQMEVIKRHKLTDVLKNTNDFVIGFCAGAINLSPHAIITSDNDFSTPSTYKGIGRIPLNMEPHFKWDNTDFTKNRIKEIENFCNELKINITALCDKSCIFIDDNNIKVYGRIYEFNKN